MSKKQCLNCQYFREGSWCSNSKSPRLLDNVSPLDGCAEFSKRGKKAPLWMRVAIKLLGRDK